MGKIKNGGMQNVNLVPEDFPMEYEQYKEYIKNNFPGEYRLYERFLKDLDKYNDIYKSVMKNPKSLSKNEVNTLEDNYKSYLNNMKQIDEIAKLTKSEIKVYLLGRMKLILFNLRQIMNKIHVIATGETIY